MILSFMVNARPLERVNVDVEQNGNVIRRIEMNDVFIAGVHTTNGRSPLQHVTLNFGAAHVSFGEK
jgi:hypothetical protein